MPVCNTYLGRTSQRCLDHYATTFSFFFSFPLLRALLLLVIANAIKVTASFPLARILTSCHARREFFFFLSENCNIFSVLSIFECKGETNNKFITSQSFLSGDIPTSFEKKRATSYCIRFWSLVMVRNQKKSELHNGDADLK